MIFMTYPYRRLYLSKSNICLKASFIIIVLNQYWEVSWTNTPWISRWMLQTATFNKKFLFQCVILSTLLPICKDSCGAKCFSLYYWFAMALWLRGFRIVEINWSLDSVLYKFTFKNYHTLCHSLNGTVRIIFWYILHDQCTFSNLFGQQQQNPDDLTSSMGIHPTRWFHHQQTSADSTNVTRKFGSGSKDHVEVFLGAWKTNKTAHPGCSWLSRVWIKGWKNGWVKKRKKKKKENNGRYSDVCFQNHLCWHCFPRCMQRRICSRVFFVVCVFGCYVAHFKVGASWYRT